MRSFKTTNTYKKITYIKQLFFQTIMKDQTAASSNVIFTFFSLFRLEKTECWSSRMHHLSLVFRYFDYIDYIYIVTQERAGSPLVAIYPSPNPSQKYNFRDTINKSYQYDDNLCCCYAKPTTSSSILAVVRNVSVLC